NIHRLSMQYFSSYSAGNKASKIYLSNTLRQKFRKLKLTPGHQFFLPPKKTDKKNLPKILRNRKVAHIFATNWFPKLKSVANEKRCFPSHSRPYTQSHSCIDSITSIDAQCTGSGI